MTIPSAQIIAEASATLTVTDALGRQLILRRLTALDKLRLFKAVGAYLSANEPYLGMAMLAYCVTSIDGVPVPPPATEQQIEALISRLGDAGIAAAARALPDQGIPERQPTESLSGN